LRVEPQTWEAFRLTALDGLSGADAAQQLGLRITAVFKAKSRVQEMLRATVARLESNGDGR
jgi:RNA polymerase sigma-70 factor (ECF subfamily)